MTRWLGAGTAFVRRPVPEPARSVLAGAAGTAVVTAGYALERRLRHADTPLDYDDSDVPGEIVASILHLPSVTEREEHELGLMLRWGYGSAFGLGHGLPRRRLREPAASAAFAATLIGATVTLFPLLGHTPPAWRWARGYIVTCLPLTSPTPSRSGRSMIGCGAAEPDSEYHPSPCRRRRPAHGG